MAWAEEGGGSKAERLVMDGPKSSGWDMKMAVSDALPRPFDELEE